MSCLVCLILSCLRPPYALEQVGGSLTDLQRSLTVQLLTEELPQGHRVSDAQYDTVLSAPHRGPEAARLRMTPS